MADYIPAPDAEFNAWQVNFVTYANANLAALGLVAADMATITAAQTTWTSAFPAHVTAVAAAMAAKQAKDDARLAYIAVVRALVRRLQASPAVSDAERASLGINVPGSGGGPVGPPTSRPLVAVECGQRLQHTLRFTDENTPTRKAKPPGVLGAEVWAKIGPPGTTPPADQSEMDFFGLDTRTPFTKTFPGADGNKVAFYWLRWVSSTGEVGPWSETATATIAA